MSELKEKIADLIIENERIKKTSFSRFEQNKDLKLKSNHLDILKSRFKSLKEFLITNGFDIRVYECQERVDFSAMNTIRGLLALNKKIPVVSVAGIYTVKVNGKYKLAKIKHDICWWLTFDLDSKKPKYEGMHHIDIKEFILIELDKKEVK